MSAIVHDEVNNLELPVLMKSVPRSISLSPLIDNGYKLISCGWNRCPHGHHWSHHRQQSPNQENHIILPVDLLRLNLNKLDLNDYCKWEMDHISFSLVIDSHGEKEGREPRWQWHGGAYKRQVIANSQANCLCLVVLLNHWVPQCDHSSSRARKWDYLEMY